MRRIIFTCLALTALFSVATADDVAVTVYNSNLGVVSETRTLNFSQGVDRLAFRDVPASIDPASVRFELAGGGDGVTILEQNFVYDLVNPERMFNRYLDQNIELIDEDGNVYSGTLLAASGGTITVQESSGRVKILSRDDMREINFPVLPEGLITRPTLFWLYRSEAAGERECRVSYQTAQMSWEAEYVGQLSSDESTLGLSGWASITNNSGKTYNDATLKLVAGDIARARLDIRGGRFAEMKMAMTPMADGGFEEKAFFEYHLYSLPRKATVANREIKQVSLFEPASTEVEKVFLYRPDQNAKQVAVAIRFVNTEDRGLGMPLPAGRIRLFKPDDDGALILLGEDRINHTPKDERVDVSVGYAFDIVAEEREVERNRVSQAVDEVTYEFELRNRKDAAVTVGYEKRVHGFWEVVSSDLEMVKKDATTLTTTVEIPANTEMKVRYTIRYTRR